MLSIIPLLPRLLEKQKWLDKVGGKRKSKIFSFPFVLLWPPVGHFSKVMIWRPW